MARGTAKKFAIGAGIAAAVGYIAGLLTAPKSGKETRGDLKNAAEKATNEAEEQLKKLHSELDKLLADAKEKGDDLGGKAKREIDKLLDTANDARDKAGGIVDALRKDRATDKELKKAIEDANRAIEHLRDYLKK